MPQMNPMMGNSMGGTGTMGPNNGQKRLQ